jgi:hypothetical protein
VRILVLAGARPNTRFFSRRAVARAAVRIEVLRVLGIFSERLILGD